MKTTKATKKPTSDSGEYGINTLARELYTHAMAKDLLRIHDKDFHKECETARERARAAADIFYYNHPRGRR